MQKFEVLYERLTKNFSLNILRLKWLPKQIPSNVKILLSTLPDPEFGILHRLRQLFPKENFLEVTDLDQDSGKEILNTLLSRAHKTLTKEQNKLVIDAFAKCSTPLFLKVIFFILKHNIDC